MIERPRAGRGHRQQLGVIGAHHHMGVVGHIARHRAAHVDHAVFIAVLLQLDPAHFHVRELLAGGGQILVHRRHGGGVTARFRGRPGLHGLGGGTLELGPEHQGAQCQREQGETAHGGAGDREDQMEREADHPHQVMQVFPIAAQIALVLEREEFLFHFRPVDHQATDQRGAVQHRNHAHQVQPHRRDAELEMQLVDEPGQLRMRPLDGLPGIVEVAGVLGVPDRLAVHPFLPDGGGLVAGDQEQPVAGLRVSGDHRVQQGLHVGIAGFGGLPGLLPVMQLMVEHVDRAGEERHEQGQPGNNTHPGMQIDLPFHGVDAHQAPP